jgi:hypothetical protein
VDEMYSAMPGSPITYLAGDISAGQTTIAVVDDTALPDAPNICTIGYGEHIETIRYGAKSNGVLQDVTRGIEGTPRAWQSGTEVARFYTAHEHNQIVEICSKAVWFDMFDEWASNGGAVKVFKNLFGDSSKIHVDEIAVASGLLLGGAVIVEYEIDTNGMFIRFGNGIQICAGRHVVNRTITASWASGFSHAPETITFPKSFISEPFVSFGYSDPTGSNTMAMIAGTRITKDDVRCSIVRPADDVSRERHITYIAIGRWE